jgi:membrane protein implicated in regulation of membrane protease activity
MLSLETFFQPQLSKKTSRNHYIQRTFDPESYEKEAVVLEVIQQGKSWWIRYQGSDWKARCEQGATLDPGDDVYVVGRHNTLLLITPAVSKVPVFN